MPDVSHSTMETTTTGAPMPPHTSAPDASIAVPDMAALNFSATLLGPELASPIGETSTPTPTSKRRRLEDLPGAARHGYDQVQGAVDEYHLRVPHSPYFDLNYDTPGGRPPSQTSVHEEGSTASSPGVFSPCDSSMRRTIGNGASFQGIVKLRGPENYEEWVRAVRAAARKEGVWDMMTGVCQMPPPPPPPPPGGALAAAARAKYNDDLAYYRNKTELALGGIEGSLSAPAQAVVDGIECARAMWLKLEQEFKAPDHKALVSTKQSLDSLCLAREGGSVARLADALRLLRRTLAPLTKTQELPGWYFSIRFLLSLGPKYDDFTANMTNSSSTLVEIGHEDRFERLVALALNEAKRLV